METEIKLRIDDIGKARAKILSLGAKPLEKGPLENVYLDFGDMRFRENNELLRLRNNSLVTYKKRMADDEGVRRSEEIEFNVDDGGNFIKVMERLGLHLRDSTHRTRESFSLEGARIELDETSIGNFIEIEAERDVILRIAEKLGHGRDDFITETYGQLGEHKR